MKSIASAPAKIILFGEHFVVHGTKAILAAIDKRVTVTTTTTQKQTLKINSQLGTFEIPMYDEGVESRPNVHALAYAARRGVDDPNFARIKSEFRPFVYLAGKMLDYARSSRGYPLNFDYGGLEITIDSDIPVGVGLGSSSACCVAAAASLSAIFRMAIGKDRVEYLIKRGDIPIGNETDARFNLAKHAEQTIFPDTSGADCAGCTYGGMIEHPNIEKIDNTFDLNLLIANSMIPTTRRTVLRRSINSRKMTRKGFQNYVILKTN